MITFCKFNIEAKTRRFLIDLEEENKMNRQIFDITNKKRILKKIVSKLLKRKFQKSFCSLDRSSIYERI